MFRISREQLSKFDRTSFEQYVDKLCEEMRRDEFSSDVIELVSDANSHTEIRQLALKKIFKAIELGFECEGDITPFCLLDISHEFHTTKDSYYDWIVNILAAIEIDPEERMDAVYSLLSEKMRAKIFLKFK